METIGQYKLSKHIRSAHGGPSQGFQLYKNEEKLCTKPIPFAENKAKTKPRTKTKGSFCLKKLHFTIGLFGLFQVFLDQPVFGEFFFYPKPRTRTKTEPKLNWTNLSLYWLNCFHCAYTNLNSILAFIVKQDQWSIAGPIRKWGNQT